MASAPAKSPLVAALALAACAGRPVVGDTGVDGTSPGDASARDDGGRGAGPDATMPDAGPQRPWRGGFVRDEALSAAFARCFTEPHEGRPRNMTSVLPADLDGDGRDELLYNDNRDMYRSMGVVGATWLFRRGADGRFMAPERLPEALTQAAAAADLDADGHVDVVFAGATTMIAWGSAGGLDPARATPAPVDGCRMTFNPMDLDDDGLLDLAVGIWDQPMVVLRNRGNRTFEPVAHAWGVDGSGMTWSIARADLDGDKLDDLYVSNDGDVHVNYVYRALGVGADGEPRFTPILPRSRACEEIEPFGMTRSSPMGVSSADVDLDGRFDLALAIGPQIGIMGWSDDVRACWPLELGASTSGSFLVPWSPALWDVDHDLAVDLVVATGDDEGFSMMPNRGQSTLLLYRGAPNGGPLTLIGHAAGLDVEGQFAQVATTDLDLDGDLDLVVGQFGRDGMAFENRVEPNGGHVLLSLRGTVSNPDGRGAIVTVRAGPFTRAWPVGDRTSPQVTPPAVVDVPLGDAARADEVRVRWPSGYEQVLRDVAPGRLTVTEPRWISVEPRVMPANSNTLVTVTVRPTTSDGALDAAARVEIDAPYHTVRWEGDATRGDDGVWQRSLRAGTTPGSAVVRVRVNGREARVRPRVWFTTPQGV